MKIIPIYFILSFTFGLIITILTLPPTKIVTKIVSVSNNQKYQDANTNLCYTFEEENCNNSS